MSDWHEIRLTVGVAAGLHARPAARFVQTVAAFETEVEVEVHNLTAGVGPAPARSITSLAVLGVVRGHEILVRARGARSGEVLAALQALADRNFDEASDRATQVHVPAGAAPSLGGPGDGLRGLPGAPGVVLAPARRLQRIPAGTGPRSAGSPEDEWTTLERAIGGAREEVRRTRDAIAAQAGPEHAAILDAQLLILEDSALAAPARTRIEAGASADDAWAAAIGDVAEAYLALPDAYQRARASDVREAGRLVAARIAGAAAPATVWGPGVLVAEDLGPTETAGLDTDVILGIATARGAPNSHSAIVARALGIPAVVGLGDALMTVVEGTPLLVDGDAGTMVIDPDAAAVAAAREASRSHGGSKAPRPPVGAAVRVTANVGGAADARAAFEHGADGVGLLRTEFLFLGREVAPDEDEQVEAYRSVCAAMGGRPVTIRTLDAGGDKPLPYLAHHHEDNPMLGLRGVRLSLARPDGFRTQLRAIARVAAEHPVRAMFPMITTVDELRAARDALAEAAAEVGARPVEVGAMIEVPAAAIMADELAPLVDFFSIGTNDLTQHVMAADRTNSAVAHLTGGLPPAVLRLVESVCAAGRPVSVCGELAADADAIGALVHAGVRELSVSPRLIRDVRALVGAG